MNEEENIFKGIITALVTPMHGGKIDFAAFKNLVRIQKEAGCNGIVIGGSTGEGNCFEAEEVVELLKAARLELGAECQMKLIAGIASVSTKEAIAAINMMQSVAIDGLMVTAPHYIKPNQAGIVEHFKAADKAANVPIMAYAHPFRTGVDLTDQTIVEIAKLPKVVALKDAGADLARPIRIFNKLGSSFNLLTGNDDNSLAFVAQGGVGIVSVVGNIMPHSMKQMVNYALEGKRQEGLKLQGRLFDVYDAIFSDTNPIGSKCALSLMGLIKEEYNLPLMPASDEVREKIRIILPLIDEIENEYKK